MAGLIPGLLPAIGWGLVLGIGLWMFALGVIPQRLARLHLRVAPYVADLSPTAFRDVARAGTTRGFRRAVEHTLRGWHTVQPQQTARLERSLRRANVGLSVSEFRSRVLIALALGAVAGLVLAVPAVGGGASPALFFALPALVAVTAAWLPGWWVRRRLAARLARINEQVPVVWEFLALSLSAGENLRDALSRVCAHGKGDLVDELRSALTATRGGTSLAAELDALAHRLDVPSVSRGIEQILGALHRGAPLAAVLQEQAKESCAESKRQLLEVAGKKEVYMLFPLVFLILPVTIAFAVLPGLASITTSF
jgi:tight adherence protein C